MSRGTNRLFRMCGESRRTKTGGDGRAAKENHKKSHIQAQVARVKTRNPSAVIGVHSKTEHTLMCCCFLILLNSAFGESCTETDSFTWRSDVQETSRDSSVYFSRPRMYYFFLVFFQYVIIILICKRMSRLSWVKVNLPIQASWNWLLSVVPLRWWPQMNVFWWFTVLRRLTSMFSPISQFWDFFTISNRTLENY